MRALRETKRTKTTAKCKKKNKRDLKEEVKEGAA